MKCIVSRLWRADLEKPMLFVQCHQLIFTLTACKSVPEIKVVKKITSCFINSIYAFA